MGVVLINADLKTRDQKALECQFFMKTAVILELCLQYINWFKELMNFIKIFVQLFNLKS